MSAISLSSRPVSLDVEVQTASVGDPIGRADWLLRITVVLYVIGVASALFMRSGTTLGEIALMDYGIGGTTILNFERGVAIFLLVVAGSLLLYPTVLALLAITALVLLEAYADFTAGGFAFAQYSLFTTALRYGAPLALIPLILTKRFPPSITCRATISAWMLRLGLAIVFFIHGLEALQLNGVFIDLIIGSFRNLFDLSLSQATASNLLRVIGVVDIIVAVLILIRTWRPLLAWLFFWGFITALSRPLAHGFASYPDFLERSAHFLAALAVGWLVSGLRHPRFTETSTHETSIPNPS